MKRFRVIYRISQYITADSTEAAEKFMHELLERGRIDLRRDGETVVRVSRVMDADYLPAPEDITGKRNPAQDPRPLDWVEVREDGMATYALVTRLTKRRVYFYDALARDFRSKEFPEWTAWAKKQYKIHPAYKKELPPFVIAETVREHEAKGLLRGISASPDSSIILNVLEKYGYVPSSYEMENGYWAEVALERAIAQAILDRMNATPAPYGGKGTKVFDDDEPLDFDIPLRKDLPTIDDLRPRD